jgi:hypothetical protein
MNATGARLAALATTPVPAVVAFWWYVITHPTTLNNMAVFPAFLVVCMILAPVTGFGAAVCGAGYSGTAGGGRPGTRSPGWRPPAARSR